MLEPDKCTANNAADEVVDESRYTTVEEPGSQLANLIT